MRYRLSIHCLLFPSQISMFLPGLALYDVLYHAFFSFLYFLLALNAFSLPVNWLLLGMIALWNYLFTFSPGLDAWQWISLIALVLLGEAAETLLQLYKAKKYGASTNGTFASLVGAILGAILLSPVFWGLGALIGALLGAWLAAYLMERLLGARPRDAAFAAKGAILGRFLGMTCKIGFGALVIFLASQWLYPSQVRIPDRPEAPYKEELHVFSPKCGYNSLRHKIS